MPFGPLSRSDPVRVQPFYGYRNAERLTLNVRAMQAVEPVFEKRSFWRDFTTMLGQYASHEVEGLTVELEYETTGGKVLRQKAVTDTEGFAHFELDLPAGADQPPRTRWEKARVLWKDESGAEAEAEGWILTPGTQTRFGIVSDIDDTILETGITGNFRKIARNWKRVMAQMPSDRELVKGANAFYSAIGGKADPVSEKAGTVDALVPQARVRPVLRLFL